MFISKAKLKNLVGRVEYLERQVSDLQTAANLYQYGHHGYDRPKAIPASEAIRLILDHFGVKLSYQNSTGGYFKLTKKIGGYDANLMV